MARVINSQYATAPYSYAEAVPIPPPTNRSSFSRGPKQINDAQTNELLKQGYTNGLAQSLSTNLQVFSHRIWIVDNSGSMQQTDGHRIIDTLDPNSVRIVSATRWEEIRECVNYHIKISSLLEAPTDFRLLNNPGKIVGAQNFSVGQDTVEAAYGYSDESEALSIMSKVTPSGCTPLTSHINAIHKKLQLMAPMLQNAGSKVAIVIATDGLPTDEMAVGGKVPQQHFVNALRKLEGLPVWVVIRLCTDDDRVVEFYNNLDDQLELSLEVLDDFCGEALEVFEHNPWLNYTLALHRCREMGFHHRVFDLIDERPLTKGEVRDFLKLLFGDDRFDGVPDPSIDWMGFAYEIEKLLKQENRQWNPVSKTVTHLVDMKKLEKKYGDGGGCQCTIL